MKTPEEYENYTNITIYFHSNNYRNNVTVIENMNLMGRNQGHASRHNYYNELNKERVIVMVTFEGPFISSSP